MELVRTRTENPTAGIGAVTTLVVPELEAGYRWRFGMWLVGLGAGAGYAFVVSKSVVDMGAGPLTALYENNAQNTVYASVLGDIGIFF